MEDMARLALVEQNVRDVDTFGKILYELLRHINHILENPHDYELRTIRSETLKNFFQYEAFVDYLKSIGFRAFENGYTYPKELTLNNLRMAQAAIERKIYFCCGSLSYMERKIKSVHKLHVKKNELRHVKVLTTRNPFLLKVQTMFNEVLQYEDEELQAIAREHVPLVTLQLMALDEMREQQRKIKTGEIKGRDMPFDIALLKVLLSWYKHRFFNWVDQPACEHCGSDTTHYKSSSVTTGGELYTLEMYRCNECNALTEFPRYNNVRKLLQTRRGRCGEWANCFALLCRALGYDTRLVYSTSDHVWCEVWDYDTNEWLHLDPCESILGAPLTYSHGWGKQLSYVVAFSRDDIQDVTWRYTTQFKEVLKRRQECTEVELMEAIMALRSQRQRQVSEPRRRFLARRTLEELAQFLTERKPEDSELHGRVSGSAAWRSERGELGVRSHVFRCRRPGELCIRYSAVTDRYEIDGWSRKQIASWAAGVHSADHVFRKVEKDWKMAYLARDEESECGTVSWLLEADTGTAFTCVRVQLTAAVYEDGLVMAAMELDDHPPTPVNISQNTPTEFSGKFQKALLTVRLSGGRGRTAWQHAQLFRAPLSDPTPLLVIQANLVKDE